MKDENQIIIQEARDDLLSFATFNDKFFQIVEIHEIMAKALDKIESGEIKNLMLELPPRSGKSRIVSEFIARYLGRNPGKDVILTGHSSSLLEGFSRKIKERIESKPYQKLFPDTKITDGNGGVKNWTTTTGGEFAIYGVGGGMTGKGGHLLVIDDPYATRQDVESDTIRKKVKEWYKSTFLSRKQNENSAIIIIMQRWREDDLVGELLTEEKEDWTRISIPAINDNGESFWPEKFSVPYLEKFRDKLGEYFFMSQYQQDPVNLGGGDFQQSMFEYYDTTHIQKIKDRLKIISFIDPASSEKKGADYNAIVTIAVDIESNYIYILQVKRLKTSFGEILNNVFDTAKTFINIGISYEFGVEVISYQKTLATVIKKEMRLRDFFFTIKEVGSQGNKNARILTSLQPSYSTHRIIHFQFGENIAKLETELLKFPNGKHDDMIDALSSAVLISKVESKEVVQEINVVEV